MLSAYRFSNNGSSSLMNSFTNRGSHQSCSIKKAVPKNFAIFTGKHQCWSLFSLKFQGCDLI